MGMRGEEGPGPDRRLFELEDFGEIGEIAATVLRDKHHVLDSDCSQSWVIQPWFDRDDVALLEK